MNSRPAIDIEDARTVAGRMDERWRAFVLTLAATPFTVEQVAAIRLEDVDAGTLTITAEGDPLAVPEWLVRELQRHVIFEPTHGGRVFSTAEGEPIDPAAFRAAWREAAQDAGLGHLDVGAI